MKPPSINPFTKKRSHDVAPGASIEEVLTQSVATAALAHGRFFYATTPRLQAGSSENIRISFANPASSGRLITVVMMVGIVGPDQIVEANFFLNPDTGLPATFYTPTNGVLGHPYASVVEFAADTSGTALSGGTSLDLDMIMHQGRNEATALAVIDEGVTVGINIPLGLLSAGDGGFAAYYVEQDK